MPAVFWDRGYKFHFYSSDCDPREPVHIHVAKRGEADAKLWLYRNVTFAYHKGFDARLQRWIIGVVEARQAEIESAWNGHFGTSD